MIAVSAWSSAYLRNVRCEFGEIVDVQQAIASGSYSVQDQQRNGYQSASVSKERNTLDLAVRAARETADNGLPGSPTLWVHASCSFSEAFPAPASYVAEQSMRAKCLAINLVQHSNGGLVALQLASDHVELSDDRLAMITTAEPVSYSEHWELEMGVVFGDAGTAAVVTPDLGAWRVVSSAFEGDGGWLELSLADYRTEAERLEFLIDNSEELGVMLETVTNSSRSVITAASETAGAPRQEITRWVFPFVGVTQTDHDLLEWIGAGEPVHTAWDFGRTVGHLGAGDHLAALAALEDHMQPGETVGLFGVGLGFNVGCMVVERTDFGAG